MLLVMAFNSFTIKEIQFVDTDRLNAATKKEVSEALAKQKNDTKSTVKQYWVERYDYSKFYEKVKKGFVPAIYPLQIDGALYIYEYDQDDSNYSW